LATCRITLPPRRGWTKVSDAASSRFSPTASGHIRRGTWIRPRAPGGMPRSSPVSRAGPAVDGKGTPEEIKANYEGVISYFGPYEFDAEEGFVLHHVEGSLFPNWEGQAQKRFFELSGNRLTLSTPPTLWGGGGEIVAVLTWERIE